MIILRPKKEVSWIKVMMFMGLPHFCRISYSSASFLACVDQPKALVAFHVPGCQFQQRCGQNGLTIGGELVEVRWRGES